MYSLSDDEKDKLFAEEVYRTSIQQNINNKSTGNLFNIINSPFIVTFLGAFLIAIFGLIWQELSNAKYKDMARWEAMQNQKYEILSSFIQDFESTVMTYGTLLKYRFKISSIKDKLKQNQSSSKLLNELEENNECYKKTWYLFQSTPKFNAYYVKIKVIYKSETVLTSLQKLDKALSNLQKSKTITELYKNMKPVNEHFLSLAIAMSDEISSKKF